MNHNYASFGSRFVAFIIDAVLMALAQGIIGFILGLVLGDNGQYLSSIISIGLSIYYWVVYQAMTGQTIGKKAMKIQVVTVSGEKPVYMTFVLRELLGKFVSSLIFGLGYLFPLWDEKKQALHDKIAGTLVVIAGSAPVQQATAQVSQPATPAAVPPVTTPEPQTQQ